MNNHSQHQGQQQQHHNHSQHHSQHQGQVQARPAYSTSPANGGLTLPLPTQDDQFDDGLTLDQRERKQRIYEENVI